MCIRDRFERTLIIADEGSQVHYVEGCSAPVYSTDSLHSAVVELVALPGARITYTTIQNLSLIHISSWTPTSVECWPVRLPIGH